MSLRLAATIAACLALIAAGAWLSRSAWKPALDRAVAAAFNAQDQVDAGALSASADLLTDRQTEAWSDQRMAGRAVVTDLERAIREDPDASTPLAADRLDRLRDADRRLCGLRPALGGCPPPAPDDARLD